MWHCANKAASPQGNPDCADFCARPFNRARESRSLSALQTTPGSRPRPPRPKGASFLGKEKHDEQHARRGRSLHALRQANSQYETEFEPATGTLWGYFNPRQGAPCFSLGLLKDIREHDHELAANGGKRRDRTGRATRSNYYVTASRVPRRVQRRRRPGAVRDADQGRATARRSRTTRSCASTTCYRAHRRASSARR